MNSTPQKIIVNIEDSKYLSWEICLKNKLKILKQSNIEIDCKNLDLSCTDILEVIAIANQYNCKVIAFSSNLLQRRQRP